VEEAVREGLERSPWEEVREQVVLGGEEFLRELRGYVRGNAREQCGAGRLSLARPSLAEVIGAVERMKGEKWLEFRDRHGDSGRDLVLYAGRRACALTLGELAAACGMRDYGAASAAIRRYERRLRSDREEQKQFKRLCQLSNIQM
jgi:hypothetical protein